MYYILYLKLPHFHLENLKFSIFKLKNKCFSMLLLQTIESAFVIKLSKIEYKLIPFLINLFIDQ